jgi:hypothetical protein
MSFELLNVSAFDLYNLVHVLNTHKSIHGLSVRSSRLWLGFKLLQYFKMHYLVVVSVSVLSGV